MARSSRQKSHDDISVISLADRDVRSFIVICLVAVLVVVGLVRFQVVGASEYSQRAEEIHLKNTQLVAKRGTIYDRNGEVLASSVTSYTVNVNPNDIDYDQTVTKEQKEALPDAAGEVAQLLYEYLGDEADKTYEEMYSLVTAENTSYSIIMRQASEDNVDKLKEAMTAAKLAGVYYEEDSTRIYPNGKVASQLIGTVSLKMVDSNNEIVADEDVADSTESLTETYRGNSGLELQYDSLLSGTNGVLSQEKSNTGIPIAGGEIYLQESEDGADIVTSIDIKLQQKAEKSIKKACEKYGAKGGSVTVMDASSGEIYAACSFSKSGGSYEVDAGKLWSATDSYEPGSTFKAMTALSLFNNKTISANTTFTVPDSMEVYDHKVSDSHDHDTVNMTFRQIIAESSNVGTVLASRQGTLKQLYKTYSKLGFGSDSGVDFPGAASGLLESSEDWDGVQAANVTFGQGVAVTGIQLVRAYGAIEQGGVLRTPHFYTSSTGNDDVFEEKYVERVEKLTSSKRVAKKKACKQVTSLLESVVTDGTGKAGKVDGYTVAAKTGTAEIANSTGGYKSGVYIVSYCGWLEGSDSDLICLVTMDEPETEEGGGPVCGPVFADIMSFAANRYQINANAD